MVVYVRSQGTCVYAAWVEDQTLLDFLGKVLVGTAEHSVLSNLVHSNHLDFDLEWTKQHFDGINPFHDHNCPHARLHRARHYEPSIPPTYWTFDLDSAILRCDKKDENLAAPLQLVRQRLVTLDNFKSYQPASLTPDNLQAYFGLPNSNAEGIRRPIAPHLQRHKAFLGQILGDFAQRWRYMLCDRYSQPAFGLFAYAVIRLMSLDFEVKQLAYPGLWKSDYIRDYYPLWSGFTPPGAVRVVQTEWDTVIMCPHIPTAIRMIREDVAREIADGRRRPRKSKHYLVLTLREAIRFEVNTSMEPVFSEGYHLFDGVNRPQDAVVGLLLESLHAPSASWNRIRRLPLELQDMILKQVSPSPLECERIGCILGIGTPFAWGRSEIKLQQGADVKYHDAKARLIPGTEYWILRFPSGESSNVVYN